MDNLQFIIMDNLFIITIAIFVFFYLIGLVRKKKNKEKYEKNVIELQEEAKRLNIDVSKQPPNISAMSYDLSHGMDKNFGDTIYDGTSRNLKWKLVSTVKYTDDYATTSRKTLYQQTLKWITNDKKLDNNYYVMIMDTPVEIKSDFNNETGFMNSIKNFVAEKALDFYISNYFGTEYKDLINISDGKIIRNNNLKNYLIITNKIELANQILDENFTNLINNWDQRTANLTNSNLMKTPGILFAPDKTIITCQSSVKNAEEAVVYSEICAELLEKVDIKS